MAHDDVFTVISDGTRRQLLDALREGDRSVGELVEALGVSQPTVSKHLKVLREAGLATMRAEGQRRYYSVSPEPLGHAARWLAAFAAGATASVPATTPEPATTPVPATEPAPAVVPTVLPAVTAATPARETASILAPAVAPAVAPAIASTPAATAPGVPMAGPVAPAQATQAAQQLGRTVGRTVEQVTGRAADLLERLQKPKFGRRR
jgi:DNA-binding transcriptional ArsR family regulator